jgi:ubiquinone/menaquinone biosynthesis C-methylase UbiE
MTVPGRDGHTWKANSQAQFERWAETYDQSILQRLLFRRCYLKFIELILGRCDPNRNGDLLLLDVGCGTGSFIVLLAQTAAPVRSVGLDMAAGMCERGWEKTARLHLADRVRFVVADAERLPMGEAVFDVVTCSNSFHHYPDQAAVLNQMHRVLKPGGRLIILDGFRDNVIGWFLFDVCVGLAEKSVHHCSASAMRRLLAEAGFRDVFQEKFGFWVPVLATVAVKNGDRVSGSSGPSRG